MHRRFFAAAGGGGLGQDDAEPDGGGGEQDDCGAGARGAESVGKGLGLVDRARERDGATERRRERATERKRDGEIRDERKATAGQLSRLRFARQRYGGEYGDG